MISNTPTALSSASRSDLTALLVLDLQVDFLNPSGRMPIAADQTDPVLAASNRAIEAAASRHLPIVYIGNEYTGWDIPGNWFRHDAARAGTPGAALDPRLHKIAGAPYFSKHRGDGFSNPDLERFLRSHNVGRIVLCGVYAGDCVTATARGAINRGLGVVILSDAVGAGTDSARNSALAKLSRSSARVETSNAFVSGLVKPAR